jgi:hypothetical protein
MPDEPTSADEQPQEPQQLGVKETIAALKSAVESGELPREITQRNASDGGVRSSEEPAAGDLANDPLIVEVPADGPDGEPFHLQVETPEDAARVRQALAGAESAREVAELQQEYAIFEDQLAHDPGFVVYAHMTPEGRVELAKLLMADEAVAEGVAADTRSPEQIQLEAIQRRETARARVETKQFARTVAGAVDRLVADLDDDARPSRATTSFKISRATFGRRAACSDRRHSGTDPAPARAVGHRPRRSADAPAQAATSPRPSAFDPRGSRRARRGEGDRPAPRRRREAAAQRSPRCRVGPVPPRRGSSRRLPRREGQDRMASPEVRPLTGARYVSADEATGIECSAARMTAGTCAARTR